MNNKVVWRGAALATVESFGPSYASGRNRNLCGWAYYRWVLPAAVDNLATTRTLTKKNVYTRGKGHTAPKRPVSKTLLQLSLQLCPPGYSRYKRFCQTVVLAAPYSRGPLPAQPYSTPNQYPRLRITFPRPLPYTGQSRLVSRCMCFLLPWRQ